MGGTHIGSTKLSPHSVEAWLGLRVRGVEHTDLPVYWAHCVPPLKSAAAFKRLPHGFQTSLLRVKNESKKTKKGPLFHCHTFVKTTVHSGVRARKCKNIRSIHIIFFFSVYRRGGCKVIITFLIHV